MPVWRTNTLIYASSSDLSRDGIQLLEHRGPYNEIIRQYTPHSTYPDQYGTFKTGVDEVTTYNYLDSTRRLWTVQTHAGLLSTYSYGADGRLQKIVDTISGTPIRTNEFTWMNGLLRTHKDPRGLTRTFTIDYLGRVTQISYPDSTTEQLFYALPAGMGFNSTGSALGLLDLTSWKDRLNNYWYVLPNRLRQLETIIEPAHGAGGSPVQTSFEYCGCGSPTTITRAVGVPGVQHTTSLDYDFQGRLRFLFLPDASIVTNEYDVLGRLYIRKDAFSQQTYLYDTFNRIIQVSNGSGLLAARAYDLRDRVLQSWDENRLWITNSYDNLGRLLIRGYPDGGKERWFYTPGYSGPTAYWDQLTNVTTWAYDKADRRTNEAVVGVYTNSFKYNGADDLVELRDGRNKPTSWIYDAYGQVISKSDAYFRVVLTNLFDANGRQIRRWTPAKGLTHFGYDSVGNLTGVTYPASATITYIYDEINRLKSMLDATGTTSFGYTLAGGQEIVTEDGPWTDDTVSITNRLGRRTGLGVQQSPSAHWSVTNVYAAHRLASVTSPAGTFSYLYTNTTPGTASAGSLVARILLPTTGGTAYLTNTYDSVGRLLSTQLRNSTHSVLNGHQYLPNLANQRKRMTRSGTQYSYYEDYGYDTIGQLRSATNSLGSASDFSYGYDPAQNLMARTNGSVVQAFGVDDVNQLNLGPTGSYAYDDNGNMTGAQGGALLYGYDDENQLVTIEQPGSARTEFTYDGLGRLRRKVDLTWATGGGGSSGPVGYWAFDDGTGITATDSSGNSLHGTLQSGPTWTTGQVGSGAIQFDGVNEYVEVGTQPPLVMTTSMSLCAWIYPTSGSGTRIIANKEGEYEVAVLGGTIQWAFANSNPGWAWINTSYSPALNQWTHVAVVYSNGVVQTYANGALVHTYSGAGVIGDVNTSLNLFIIGGRQWAVEHFAGKIDDVRLYNRALSSGEVASLHSGGGGGTSTLVGRWRLDEGSGATTADTSGYGHNGSLQAGVAWTAGQYVDALSFDGSDDYVQVGSQTPLAMSTSLTLSAWIYPTSVSGVRTIANKEGEYEVAVYDGTVQWAFANSNPGWDWRNTGYSPPLNQWTHVAIVYDSGTVRTYANGTLVHTYPGSGNIGDVNTSLNDFRIGGRQWASHFFGGKIDEVRLFQSALSATDIATLAAGGEVTGGGGGGGGGGGSWTATAETRYVYDGMQVVQERDGSNTPQVAYTRGLDLSGTLDRAGGIGGLLARSHGYSGGTWSTDHFYHADGNGNITHLIKKDQTFGCAYRYAPYGALLASVDGNLNAADNVYRFSSKRFFPSLGLYYYGFRFYDPNLQRWLNRDPLGEAGGINLYQAFQNSPLFFVDPLGLDTFCQNRQLNPKNSKTRSPVEHPISHTFVYTTNPDGSLKDTYSWGNEYDAAGNGLWFKNRPEDVSAAQDAIQQRAEYEKAPVWKKPFKPDNFGRRVGGPELDPKIEQAFQKKANDPNDPSRHRWKLFNNRKHEAKALIEEAKRLP